MPHNQPPKVAVSELAGTAGKPHRRHATATWRRHLDASSADDPSTTTASPPPSGPATAAPSGAAMESEWDGVNLRDMLRSMYFYWRLGLLTALLAGTFGFFWWQAQPTTTTNESRIIKKRLMRSWFIMAAPDDWDRTLETDLALFQSEPVAEVAQKLMRAVSRLNNRQLAQFMQNRRTSDTSGISPLSDSVGLPIDERVAQQLPWLVVDYPTATVLDPSEAFNSSRDSLLLNHNLAAVLVSTFLAAREAGHAAEIERLAEASPARLMGLVGVQGQADSGEIVITCTHPNPVLGAFYANLMPIAFIALNDRQVLTSNRRDVRVFENMLSVAKAELSNAEAQMKQMQKVLDDKLSAVAQNNTFDVHGLEYGQLRRQLGELQTDIRMEESRVHTLAQELETTRTEYRSVADPLRQKINQLQERYNLMGITLTDENPQMIQLRRELDGRRRQYAERGEDNFEPDPTNHLAFMTLQEYRRTTALLKQSQAKLELLREQQQDLQLQLEAYPTLSAPMETYRIEVRSLESKVQAITQALEDTRFKAAKVPEYYEWKRSANPDAASETSKSRYLVGIIALAIFAGLAMTRVASMLDSRVQTESQVRQTTHLPVLVNLPTLNRQNRFVCRDTTGGRETNGFVYNLFGILGINVRHLGPKRPEQLTCVISTMPGEGKSMVAFNLAAYYASQGLRTCLLQTDYRHADLEMFPELHADKVPGYIELLAGNGEIHTLEEALYPTDLENLFICVPGRITAPPMYLFDSPGFGEFLDDLQSVFDAVIIDTAPMLLVADTAVIARHARAVILVAGLGVVTKAALRTCLDRLQMQRLPIIGTVINRDYMASYSYYYRYYGTAVPDLNPVGNVPAQRGTTMTQTDFAPIARSVSQAAQWADSQGYAATSESQALLAAAQAAYYDGEQYRSKGHLAAASASTSDPDHGHENGHGNGNGNGSGSSVYVAYPSNQVRYHHHPIAASASRVQATPDANASSRRQPVVPYIETLPPVHDQPPGSSSEVSEFTSPGHLSGPHDVYGDAHASDYDSDYPPDSNGPDDYHGPSTGNH